MSRAAAWLLTAGVLLFAAILVSQGVAAVLGTLALARWWLLAIAAIHLVPLVLDAASIQVLFEPNGPRITLRDAVLARWAGESANSFLPAGPIGGPIVMARQLAQRGIPMPAAAAMMTVGTTLQTLAQVVFATIGMGVLAARVGFGLQHSVRVPLFVAGGILGFCLAGFYLLQRRGLFTRLIHLISRLAARRDWSQLVSQAHAIDAAIPGIYRRTGRGTASFVLGLIGWLIGTAEVYCVLRVIGAPVGWEEALLLESLGQAIRSAGFLIPGSLGVQEGGFLLLAPLAQLRPETALALSLAKRARELVLGLPGLLYLQISERRSRRRRAADGPGA